MDLRAGIVLDGRYELTERLSCGPMSRIYAAWDARVKRFVAIKIASDGWGLRVYDDPDRTQPYPRPRTHDNVARLKREAVALASLDHPRIVRALESGCLDEGYYLVLERLDGVSLDRLLDDGGPLPIKDVVKIGAQALEGLEAVHRAGLVHRDIKPGNLMRTPHGVKLIDFGLVALSEAKGVIPRSRRLTPNGVAVGTALYISVEQATAAPVDGRADLYSLAHALYHLLTGRSPIADTSEDTAVALMLLHQQRAPRPFKETAPRLKMPARLEAALFRAMEKSPQARFACAAEMREALLAALP